jgi:hypothetical protein
MSNVSALTALTAWMSADAVSALAGLGGTACKNETARAQIKSKDKK